MKHRVYINPLSLILCLLPLIAFLHYTPCPPALYAFAWTGEWDIFTFWKDKMLWALCLAGLFFTRRFSGLILIFMSFLFYSYCHSTNGDLSLWGLPNYSEGAVTFLCYCLVFTSAGCFTDEEFKKYLAIGILSVGLLAIIQLIYGNYLNCPPFKFISGLWHYQTNGIPYPLYMSFMNPNHLGLYCAMILPVVLRLDYQTGWFAAIITALTVGCGSRAAWLSALLTLPKRFWNRYLMLIIGLLTAFFHTIVFDKLSNFFTTSGRTYMWKESLPSLQLLGRGPATFVLDFPQWKIAEKIAAGLPVNTVIDRPHNILIQIAHATGILSLIPMSLIVFFALKKDTPYRYGIIGFLICAMFTDSMVGVTPIFCILLGMNYQWDGKLKIFGR